MAFIKSDYIDAILKLLTALSGDEKYIEVLKTEGGKPKNMCEVLDRMFKKKDAEIAELKKEQADKDAKLADKDAKLAKSENDAAILRKQLVDAGIVPMA